jgi:hypothetical protein
MDVGDAVATISLSARVVSTIDRLSKTPSRMRGSLHERA